MSSHYKINVLPKPSKNLEPFVITYTHKPFAQIVKYRKVKYDPLTYDQAEQVDIFLYLKTRRRCVKLLYH